MISDTVAELAAIEHKLAAAFAAGDPSFHTKVLADDWSVIDPAGRVLTKEQVLRESFSGERDLAPSKIDDIKVRDFGDFAILTGRTRVVGKISGADVDVTLRFTDVFRRAEDIWQCIASQGTMINEP